MPRLRQQRERVCSSQRGVTGREERADVFHPRGTENRVRQRVRENVAVGVPCRTAWVLDADTGENERNAVLESMCIEPCADAEVGHASTAAASAVNVRRGTPTASAACSH